MQLALTIDQKEELEKVGVEEVEKRLEAGKFGSYRKALVWEWVYKKRAELEAKAAEEPKPKAKAKKHD